jgi:hydrogenase maturation factor
VEPIPLGPGALREGDELIVTGPIGRHGIAALRAREELALEPQPCCHVFAKRQSLMFDIADGHGNHRQYRQFLTRSSTRTSHRRP